MLLKYFFDSFVTSEFIFIYPMQGALKVQFII